jgi:hypothetical protein
VTPFLRRVLDRADALGLRWYEHLALVLAAALLSVLGEVAWEEIRSIDWKVEPSPEPISDGGVAEDRDLAPAEVTTGEPGGGETGGMG